MKSFTKNKLALAVAAGVLMSPAAFATNGIIQAGNGMVAHGVGGAGLANAAEASSGTDNPALISGTGNSIGMAFSIFMPDREVDTRNTVVDPLGGMGGPYAGLGALNVSDSKMYAIPQMAFTSKSGDVSWGIMAYAMGGMSTDYRSGPFPGTTIFGAGYEHAADPQSVSLSGMIIAPTVSYAINKDIAVGASLIVGYEVLTMRNLFGMGAVGTGEGSAVGYGVKVGVSANVAPGVTLGAMVQPKLSMDEITAFKNFLSDPAINFKGDAALTLPNEAGIGAKFAVGKSVDIMADVLWYQWSGVDVFEFFGWEDQVVYKAGVEFRPTDAFAIRAGFNYGKSPIQGGNRTLNGTHDVAFANYPFPAISEQHYTLGLGYKMDKSMSVNAYYLYSPEATETATGNSNNNGLGPKTEIRMSQHAFGIGINYATK